MSLTIRTNLPSIIAQGSLNKSTNALNESIKRMTTGLRINSAKDDAAGYSIVNDMTTKLSSWEVAESNTKTGIDLVTTAGDSLELVNSHLQRIRDLCEQAANGTYGETSKNAIQAEIDARVAEIKRITESAEFNGIKLFEGAISEETTNSSSSSSSTPLLTSASSTPLMATSSDESTLPVASKGPNGKFIDDIVEEIPDIIVTDPTQLASAIADNTKIGIDNAETLAKLAELVNSGKSCKGKTIILTSDIDLSGYRTGTGWTPIGKERRFFHAYDFQGTFNGNGHVVSNLYINDTTAVYKGLFGYTEGEIKNVGIENCEITGQSSVGGLVGCADGATITNCYATGTVTATANCVGGIVGLCMSSSIIDSYATVNVSGTGERVGGLTGDAHIITNSYATGNVSGKGYVGGLT